MGGTSAGASDLSAGGAQGLAQAADLLQPGLDGVPVGGAGGQAERGPGHGQPWQQRGPRQPPRVPGMVVGRGHLAGPRHVGHGRSAAAASMSDSVRQMKLVIDDWRIMPGDFMEAV